MVETVRLINRYVRRYTTLSSALDTLVQRRLTLLSPAKWDDTNDVDFMELYRAHTGAASVLALCCAMAAETYHHWKVFAEGMEGICIEFEKRALEHSLGKQPGIIARPVDYLLVKQIESLGPTDADRLPFIKRTGFRDEREWRILAVCHNEPKLTLSVPIDLSSITRIILNPWMPPALAENVRAIIKGLPDCAGIKVEASALTNSKRWKAAGKALVS